MILINRDRMIMIDTAGGTVVRVSPDGKLVAHRLPDSFDPIEGFPIIFDGLINAEASMMLNKIAEMATIGVGVMDTTKLSNEVLEFGDAKE